MTRQILYAPMPEADRPSNDCSVRYPSRGEAIAAAAGIVEALTWSPEKFSVGPVYEGIWIRDWEGTEDAWTIMHGEEEVLSLYRLSDGGYLLEGIC